MKPWQIWIDTGGTFTDCIALDPKGLRHRLKVLSNGALRGRINRQLSATTFEVELHWPVADDIYELYRIDILGNSHPQAEVVRVDTARGIVEIAKPLRGKFDGLTVELSTGEEVPVFASRLLTRTRVNQSFPAIEMKLGSTRGTNAILERKGASTALLVTKGFKDLLVIGNQQRPDLFALEIIKEAPLYSIVIEVHERIEAGGTILKKLEDEEIERIIMLLKKMKIESVAIAFLNGYKNDWHERSLKEQLIRAGFEFVSTSHELSKQVRILPRAETAIANAYLSPVIHRYLANIQQGLASASLQVMSSAGSLVDVNAYFPKDSLLSGPAGGVVGAAITARKSGVEKLITFDMGGTSTDVSLYDQRFDYRYEAQVGTLKILSPSLAIETIAAGGGSICDFDGYRLTVGPASAGAFPGPACYGAGGPLTITDVNLLLGKVNPTLFAIPLSLEKAEMALNTLLQKIKRATDKVPTRIQLLRSLTQIANEKMAEAIRKVSTQTGHNPSDFTLLSFGGAGGQHACELASMLQMKNVLIPYDAGLLSAYGIGHAKVERFKEELVLRPLVEHHVQIQPIVSTLFSQGVQQLESEGYATSTIGLDKVFAFLRFRGQEAALEIDIRGLSQLDEIVQRFRSQYESIYGHWLENRDIELESIRVIVSVEERASERSTHHPQRYKPQSNATTRQRSIYKWEELREGATINGPALVVSNNSTTVVEEGWQFYLDAQNNALLSHRLLKSRTDRHAQEAELELYTNRFTAVAQEMGALLQRTSFSVNVKERLDFSCAVLDSHGYLVVNAPHIPVHLGSMGVCVREVLKAIRVEEGDVVITNHPAFGGSHLPDVTLIKPVYYKKKRIGFVANRAHHAEIGGRRPGSMPADATRLDEEGVIIAPTYLVKKGKVNWESIYTLFTTGRYPTRLWEENQADLNGALAAITYGEKALQELCHRQSATKVVRYMDKLREHASSLLQHAISQLPAKRFSATEKLDDGSKLKAELWKEKKRLHIDFTGSSDVNRGNLNATKAIVQSVVLYVLRLLVNRPMPMNEGLMDHVILTLPTGLLSPDFSKDPQPAVVGGNTEVSQRLTDTLIKALGLAACSQGTMNNFLFGNERFGYYETICGGTGAGFGFNGASAVQQHMTNTRITDPELLELRYPIRLERFEVRKNSGGKGRWNGGDGIIREFVFLDALEINLLSQHRKEQPYGLHQGAPGKTGKQWIVRTSGGVEKLGGMDSTSVMPGDRLIIETPGGGGYGRSARASVSRREGNEEPIR